MFQKVDICGVNTSKLPLLSKKEQEELLVKIKKGDNESRNKFINGNLRLVLSVIKRFSGRGENEGSSETAGRQSFRDIRREDQGRTYKTSRFRSSGEDRRAL